MKLIKMVCPNCNANLEIDVDKGQAFCVYCGSKLLLDDETVNVKYHYVDEAKLIEANAKHADMSLRHKRYAAEDEAFQRKYARWKVLLKILLISLVGFPLALILSAILGEKVNELPKLLSDILGTWAAISVISSVFFGPFIWLLNPKRKYEKKLLQREYEAESRWRE